MSVSRWVKDSHSIYNIAYHIIWCPKGRAKIIKGAFEKKLKQILEEKSKEINIKIDTMETMPDHIHIFIKVKMLKGYSSYKLRKQFPWLKRYKALWSPSYYCETIGHISEKTIQKYIKEQKIKSL